MPALANPFSEPIFDFGGVMDPRDSYEHLERLLADYQDSLMRTEAFRSALVEIVEGYYPDSIRYAERTLEQYPD